MSWMARQFLLRRFRFSLLTLLIAISAASVALAWVGAERYKVIRRRELIALCQSHGTEVEIGFVPGELAHPGCFATKPVEIGRLRRLLGDHVVVEFYFEGGWIPSKEMQRDLVIWFPEAKLSALGVDWKCYELDGQADVPVEIINLNEDYVKNQPPATN